MPFCAERVAAPAAITRAPDLQALTYSCTATVRFPLLYRRVFGRIGRRQQLRWPLEITRDYRRLRRLRSMPFDFILWLFVASISSHQAEPNTRRGPIGCRRTRATPWFRLRLRSYPRERRALLRVAHQAATMELARAVDETTTLATTAAAPRQPSQSFPSGRSSVAGRSRPMLLATARRAVDRGYHPCLWSFSARC
jgi:hypothetical protein